MADETYDIRSKLILNSFVQNTNRLQNLHRTRQWYCRALCKISKRFNKWSISYVQTTIYGIWIEDAPWTDILYWNRVLVLTWSIGGSMVMVCGASESWADDGPALLLPCCPMVMINHGNSSMNCSGDKDRSMVHCISHTPRVLVWKWILYTITTLSSLHSGAFHKRCPTHVIIMAEDDDVIKWKHFRVTGHLCGEFTGPRWIPRPKASDAELWCYLWSVPE